jgi:hypothetical protein
MTKNTRVVMRKFRRQLRVCLNLESTHCGHPEDIALADDAANKLIELVRDEVERLSRKVGEM